MNDEKELIRLGFSKNREGDYSLSGKHQTFIARVIEYNGSVYSVLYYESKETDNRIHSPRNGLPFINRIKDCCSNGSVERAIKHYDVQDTNIRRLSVGFEILKNDLTYDRYK